MTISALSAGLVMVAAVLVGLIVSASHHEELPAREPTVFQTEPSESTLTVYCPLQVVAEESYLDRNRDLHLICTVVPLEQPGMTVPPLEQTDVGYVLYGAEDGAPYAAFSAFPDADGYVNVTVDFDGLTPYRNDGHVLHSVDDLVSYDVCSVNGQIVDHGREEHAGEMDFARANWIQNYSWYIVDYRSWGSREMAAHHTGASPDPEMRERYTWYTSPQYGPDANADGSCNYWDGRNWILAHDYSWMGQVWLTMSPGAHYFIDGVEYEAEGVFSFDRNNTIDAIYALTGTDPLIVQTCDGWVYVRVIYGYPVGKRPENLPTPIGAGNGLGTPVKVSTP